MNVYKIHCPKADRRGLGIERRDERRGMLQTEVTYREEIMNRATM
jgi:hypothetical protein